MTKNTFIGGGKKLKILTVLIICCVILTLVLFLSDSLPWYVNLSINTKGDFVKSLGIALSVLSIYAIILGFVWLGGIFLHKRFTKSDKTKFWQFPDAPH